MSNKVYRMRKGKRLGVMGKQSEGANYTTCRWWCDKYRQHEEKVGGR